MHAFVVLPPATTAPPPQASTGPDLLLLSLAGLVALGAVLAVVCL